MKIDRNITMQNMWRAYGDFKDLLAFYEYHKTDKRMKDRNTIETRIAELTKLGYKPRTELETLYWVLGEDIAKYDK